ncbi:MAG: NUDIX hydrolase [Solirubrobacterales bacterium]
MGDSGTPPDGDSGAPAPARPAAGIVLVRSGASHRSAGLEVLMVQRTSKAAFMPGIWVFPGGGVEDADADGPADRYADCALRELTEETGIELGGDRELVPLSRWVTPKAISRRFDTRFFVARAPGHCRPVPNGHETVDARWVRPAAALADEDFPLSFPTERDLEWLAGHDSPQALIEAARGRDQGAVQPTISDRGGETVIEVGTRSWPVPKRGG